MDIHELSAYTFQLVPKQDTTLKPDANLLARIKELELQLATMTTDRNRLHTLVAEADRKQKLCVCGSPTGIVSPAIATELAKGKVAKVINPVDGKEVEILFAI